jgi:hypothetical protein
MPRIAFLILSILLFLPVPVAAMDSQAARQELERLNIPFTNEQFLQRMNSCDAVAVEHFLDAGMDANLTDSSGNPLLIAAISKGCVSVIEALLKHGADPNSKNNDEVPKSALAIAAGAGQAEIVKLLLEYGTDVNKPFGVGTTPLIEASRKRQLEVVRILLQNGANVNAEDKNGFTPLLSVRFSSSEDPDLIEALLDAGANPNVAITNGRTALHFASFSGQMESAELLLQHGARINAKEDDGEAPLMYAAFNGSPRLVALLLKSGADANMKNDSGETALSFAVAEGHLETAKILEKAMKGNSQEKGITVLMPGERVTAKLKIKELPPISMEL